MTYNVFGGTLNPNLSCWDVRDRRVVVDGIQKVFLPEMTYYVNW